MKIEVKNLGPITSATIDLSKKLNVFCGENNTGKTYLAYLINNLNVLNVGNLEERVNFTEEADSKGFYLTPHVTMDLVVFDDLENEILCEKFGLGKDEFSRLFPKISVKLNSDPFLHYYSGSCFFDIKIGDGLYKINKEKQSEKIYVKVPLNFPENDGNYIPMRKDMFKIISGLVLKEIFAIKSTFFPIERSAIPTFINELSFRRNQYLNVVQVDKRERIRYPEVIRDTMGVSIDLINISKGISTFADFAKEIESELLGGKLNLSPAGEFQFEPTGLKEILIPFRISASTIKSLSSLVFYLRHLAKEGDLVIIDEPELNLHPENQILIARVFARMIQCGFKLLISTHSDYIIREINNLIMVASLGEDEKYLASELGYKETEFIKPEDVGVQYFHYKNEKDVEVVNLPVHKFGFEVPSIEKTINELNQRAADLYYALNTETEEKDD